MASKTICFTNDEMMITLQKPLDTVCAPTDSQTAIEKKCETVAINSLQNPHLDDKFSLIFLYLQHCILIASKTAVIYIITCSSCIQVTFKYFTFLDVVSETTSHENGFNMYHYAQIHYDK